MAGPLPDTVLSTVQPEGGVRVASLLTLRPNLDSEKDS